MNSNGKTRLPLDESEILWTLFEILKKTAQTFVVIDGIDECGRDTKRAIVDFVKRCLSLDRTSIKIILTCRNEDLILQSLQNQPRIHVSAQNSAADIRNFVTYSVRAKIESGDLKIKEKCLEDEIVSALVAKAQGM